MRVHSRRHLRWKRSKEVVLNSETWLYLLYSIPSHTAIIIQTQTTSKKVKIHLSPMKLILFDQSRSYVRKSCSGIFEIHTFHGKLHADPQNITVRIQKIIQDSCPSTSNAEWRGSCFAPCVGESRKARWDFPLHSSENFRGYLGFPFEKEVREKFGCRRSRFNSFVCSTLFVSI